MATELVKGKTIEEALQADQQRGCRGAGRAAAGQKMHCSVLAEEAHPARRSRITTRARAWTRRPSSAASGDCEHCHEEHAKSESEAE